MLKEDKTAPGGFRAPDPGEIMKNPSLSNTFRRLAENGKKGFYTGEIADEIVKVCKELGGHLELEDLKIHLELGSELVSSSSSPRDHVSIP
jgi:gamma-glutamyltranspeptidase/glutathione hydrolase